SRSWSWPTPSATGWPSSLFFFSSRRRHTRWPRDWSSDVCSSDLAADEHIVVQVDGCFGRPGGARGVLPERDVIPGRGGGRELGRSEERRVGKECRWRWGGDK